MGPRVYVARGASGWAEQFDRKASDAALRAFVAPLDLAELLDTFSEGLSLDAARATWGSVTEFLAKVTNSTAGAVPSAVGVAFWAHYKLLEHHKDTN